MRLVLLTTLLCAIGCGAAREVHLTIAADSTVTNDQLAKIRILQIAVLGDEPGGVTYGISGELTDRKTTWIYKSRIEGRLEFEVVARDASNLLVASGKSSVIKTKGSPATGKVVLGLSPPNPTKSRLGESCTDGVDTCASGFCVDGVCCASACEGSCSTCNGVTPGTCTMAPAGTSPRKACIPDPSSPCGLDGTCDGNGACRSAPVGKICGQPSCATGTFTPTATCDGAGTCTPPTTRDCAPYACNTTATACATICTPTTGCALGVTCSTTSSCGKVELGARCFSDADCAAGSCADGYCCDAPCTGSCQSCKEPGHEGTCTMVAANGTDPHGGCNDQGAASCGTTGRCDGAGACQSYPAGTICSVAACSADGTTYDAAALCDGTGAACPTQAQAACGAYRCDTDGAPGCGVSCGECTYYEESMSPPFQTECAAGKTCTNHCLDSVQLWTCD